MKTSEPFYSSVASLYKWPIVPKAGVTHCKAHFKKTVGNGRKNNSIKNKVLIISIVLYFLSLVSTDLYALTLPPDTKKLLNLTNRN